MSANLNIAEWVEAQAHPEVTHNDAIAALDAALTEKFTADLTAGNVSLTDAQFRANVRFYGDNVGTAGRTLTVPAIQRELFIVQADAANTDSFDVVRGSTDFAVGPGETWLFGTDGTANGLSGSNVGSGTGYFVPAGGSAGEVLKKNSGSDGDFDWDTDDTGGGGGGAAFPIRLDPLVVPTSASDFTTWVQQDSGSVTDLADGMLISSGTAKTSDSVQMRVRNLPATTTWIIEIGLMKLNPHKNHFATGLVLRESATNKLEIINTPSPASGGIHSNKYNSATSFNAQRAAFTGADSNLLWFFRCVRSGANLQWYVSYDGINYWEFGAAFTVTNFFTTAPDQWGCYNNGFNQSAPNLITKSLFIHWAETP